MIPLTEHQLSLRGAIWIDVNTLMSVNTLPDRLADEQSIKFGSLINLLACPIGSRGRTFQPAYGTILYHILQEPIDEDSAEKIKIGLIQAIARWEPRITMDYSQTYVLPDERLPGYRIRMAWTINLTQDRVQQDYVLTR